MPSVMVMVRVIGSGSLESAVNVGGGRKPFIGPSFTPRGATYRCPGRRAGSEDAADVGRTAVFAVALGAGGAAARTCSAGGAAAALIVGIEIPEPEGAGEEAVEAAGRAAAGGAAGAAGLAAAGGAVGRGAIGAATGFGTSMGLAATAGSVFLLMAFRTSPGLEIFERSILGF